MSPWLRVTRSCEGAGSDQQHPTGPATVLGSAGRSDDCAYTLRSMASIESPDIDSTDLFVRELRGLWEANGRPKLATLAAKSGVPRSTLGDAIAIRDRLPGEAAVRGLVQALDPDSTSTWLQRRASLASDPDEREKDSVPIGTQVREPSRRLPAFVWVLVGVIVGAIAGSLVTW